jgi:hypothetical protein
MLRTPTLGRALWYTMILTGLVVASILYTLNWSHQTGSKIFRPSGAWHGWSSAHTHPAKEEENVELPEGLYPITHLLRTAEAHLASLLNTETTTLEDAAAAYRKKRGRHPPPGFDVWYTYATNSSAVVMESFWDQIYEDLKPFWLIDPVLLRKQTHIFTPKIIVREEKLRVSTHGAYEKLDIFADLLNTLARDVSVLGFVLPDIDIPLNVNGNEEPAMLIPWETFDTLTSLFSPLPLLNPTDVVSEYTGMQDIDALTRNYTFDPQWLGPRLTHPSSHLGPRPLWSLVRPACPPNSLARKTGVYNDIWAPGGGTEEGHEAAALLPVELPGGKGRVKGYMRGWEDVIDVCEQPHLQGLHSAFVSPISMSTTQTLFPLFSDTKLAVSNEILIPDLADWTTTSSSSTSETGEPPVPWEEKSNKLHWRGTATPARDPSHYWRRFQLERLVSMLNATHVEIAEASIHSGNESSVGVGLAANMRLLPANEYGLQSLENGEMAEWVNSWGDAAFTSLDCVGGEGEGKGEGEGEEEGCGEYFSVKETEGWEEEEKRNAKFIIILDSSSSSLPQTLQSGKVTLRASIFRKWYDTRLIPWLHYIPLDNSFVDLYSVMEYFIGSGVSEEAKEFSHAVGEVQGHGHYFKTPGMNDEKEDEGEGHDSTDDMEIAPGPSTAEEENREMTGDEPHDFAKKHAKMRKRELDDHDEAARKIAEAGKAWAEKVLRREDMLVYTYRLLLEYARIIDDRRERLGWVDDFVSH